MEVTFIHHSSFLIEMEQIYVLFDYTEGQIPQLKDEKELIVFASHRHGDHYSDCIFELKKIHESTRYILSEDIKSKSLPEQISEYTDFMRPGETLVLEAGGGSIEVITYNSTDEGVAFLVSCEGKRIYHAGDLNNWTWTGESDGWNAWMQDKYHSEIDKLAGMHLTAAFLPLDPRQKENFHLGIDEFLKKVMVDYIFPMHCWGELSVIGKLKKMPCSVPYRERIMDIGSEGEKFRII